VERREGGREGGREGRRGKSRQEKKDGIESKQGEGGREGRTYLRVGQNQLMSTRNEWREGGREEGREGGTYLKVGQGRLRTGTMRKEWVKGRPSRV